MYWAGRFVVHVWDWTSDLNVEVTIFKGLINFTGTELRIIVV